MKNPKQPSDRLWYTAKLTPSAAGLFTEAFYSEAKRGTGAQHVYFTQVDVTPTTHKIVVASRLEESGIRMMTHELAVKCLIPGKKATRAEMETLNQLSVKLKI